MHADNDAVAEQGGGAHYGRRQEMPERALHPTDKEKEMCHGLDAAEHKWNRTKNRVGRTTGPHRAEETRNNDVARGTMGLKI